MSQGIQLPSRRAVSVGRTRAPLRNGLGGGVSKAEGKLGRPRRQLKSRQGAGGITNGVIADKHTGKSEVHNFNCVDGLNDSFDLERATGPSTLKAGPSKPKGRLPQKRKRSLKRKSYVALNGAVTDDFALHDVNTACMESEQVTPGRTKGLKRQCSKQLLSCRKKRRLSSHCSSSELCVADEFNNETEAVKDSDTENVEEDGQEICSSSTLTAMPNHKLSISPRRTRSRSPRRAKSRSPRAWPKTHSEPRQPLLTDIAPEISDSADLVLMQGSDNPCGEAGGQLRYPNPCTTQTHTVDDHAGNIDRSQAFCNKRSGCLDSKSHNGGGMVSDLWSKTHHTANAKDSVLEANGSLEILTLTKAAEEHLVKQESLPNPNFSSLQIDVGDYAEHHIPCSPRGGMETAGFEANGCMEENHHPISPDEMPRLQREISARSLVSKPKPQQVPSGEAPQPNLRTLRSAHKVKEMPVLVKEDMEETTDTEGEDHAGLYSATEHAGMSNCSSPQGRNTEGRHYSQTLEELLRTSTGEVKYEGKTTDATIHKKSDSHNCRKSPDPQDLQKSLKKLKMKVTPPVKSRSNKKLERNVFDDLPKQVNGPKNGSKRSRHGSGHHEPSAPPHQEQRIPKLKIRLRRESISDPSISANSSSSSLDGTPTKANAGTNIVYEILQSTPVDSASPTYASPSGHQVSPKCGKTARNSAASPCKDGGQWLIAADTSPSEKLSSCKRQDPVTPTPHSSAADGPAPKRSPLKRLRLNFGVGPDEAIDITMPVESL